MELDLRYFYARAAENDNRDRDRLRESDFRYADRSRSPKGRRADAGDSVEAACRHWSNRLRPGLRL